MVRGCSHGGGCGCSGPAVRWRHLGIPEPFSGGQSRERRVKAQLPRFSKNMVAAAEAMPAEKYNFKPIPEMNSFAHLVMHIAQSNNGLCSKISDTAAPDVKLADTDPKDKLVAALKASFEYCSAALEKVDDSKLGDQMMLFGNRPFSRAAVLIILSDDWYDHYGAQATYLRLNGILPPTAQPRKD